MFISANYSFNAIRAPVMCTGGLFVCVFVCLCVCIISNQAKTTSCVRAKPWVNLMPCCIKHTTGAAAAAAAAGGTKVPRRDKFMW